MLRHKFNLDKDIIITHNNDILLLNPRRDVTEKKSARVNSEQFYSFLQQFSDILVLMAINLYDSKHVEMYKEFLKLQKITYENANMEVAK